MDRPFVTVIACGGSGTRFGGDKAQQDLGGISLLDRVVAIAQAYGGPVALAGRNGADTAHGNLPLLPDDRPGMGPVAALASAMAFASEQGREFALLLACDQPFLPPDLPDRLLGAIGKNGAAIPVSNGHYQNMAALWRADPAALDDYIAAGGRAPWKFAEQAGMIGVEWNEAGSDPFFDIDDRHQLAEAERLIAKRPR